MPFAGKRIVITGAASGIGAASARLLRARGAYVIGADLNDSSANCAKHVDLDLTDEVSIAAVVGQIGGNIDGVCNIAGLPPTHPVARVLQVNVLGLKKFTEAMAPRLNHGASITHMASVVGSGWTAQIETIRRMLAVEQMDQVPQFAVDNGIEQTNVYQFSKACVIAYTMLNWDAYQKHAIRVNAVSPGPIDTPITPDFLATLSGKAASVMPRPGRPEEVAQAVAFLADPDNTWVNGHNLYVDGGLFAALTRQKLGASFEDSNPGQS